MGPSLSTFSVLVAPGPLANCRRKRSCLAPAFFWSVYSTHNSGRITRENSCEDKNIHFSVCVYWSTPKQGPPVQGLIIIFTYFITILITIPCLSISLQTHQKSNEIQLSAVTPQHSSNEIVTFRTPQLKFYFFLVRRKAGITRSLAQHEGLTDSSQVSIEMH